jgi:hypothetical protein
MKPSDQEFIKSQILHKESEYLRRKYEIQPNVDGNDSVLKISNL